MNESSEEKQVSLLHGQNAHELNWNCENTVQLSKNENYGAIFYYLTCNVDIHPL